MAWDSQAEMFRIKAGPRGKWSFSIECAYQHYEIMLKLSLPGTDAILKNEWQHFYNYVQCHDQEGLLFQGYYTFMESI